MAKKKKKNPASPDAAPERKPGAPFFTPRRCALACVGTLCALWLVQFAGVLFGSANLWNDIEQLDYPIRAFSRLALLGGEFPHWNPFTFGGMPFHATGASFFYPLNLLMSVLPLGDNAAWRLLQLTITSHVLIAGLCMFYYLRFKERTHTASLFGAAAFMFGGYMITHVIHASIIYIVAWMPLLLILLERGIAEMKPRHAVLGGLLLGAVMQAGHAQVMFYALAFMFTYGVYFILRPTALSRDTAANDNAAPRKLLPPLPPKNIIVKRTAVTAVFFAIAAGLCMVQYLPIFEASGQTQRISYTMNQAFEGSLQFAQFLTALLPKLFGGNTGQALGVPSFWLQDTFTSGNHIYWETSFYFGVSTLILSLFALRKIRRDGSVVMAAGWILLSLLIALGGNFFFYKMLYALGIPGFNSFRHTPRILFIWGFLFPVMAAFALDSLSSLKSKRSMITAVSLCAAAALFGIITAAGGLHSLFPQINADPVRAQYASQQGIFLLVNALLFGVALILFFTNKIKANTAKLLITACLAGDMLSFAAGQHIVPVEQTVVRNGQEGIVRNEGAAAVFRKAQANVDQIKKMRAEEIARVNTRQFLIVPQTKISGHTNFYIMERNQGYVSGIEIMEGYNPFRLKYESLPLNSEKFGTLLDLMNIRYYINPQYNPQQKDAGPQMMLANETRLPRAKLFYKAAVVSVPNGAAASVVDSLTLDYMNSYHYDHRSEVVVADKEFSKFTGIAGQGKVQITKYKNNRIELDADTDREAILWMSEIWYPAWKASVNGNKTEIYRANHSFRAVIIPPGQSKVVFKFDSAAFNAGAIISLLTLIFALLYLFKGYFTKKKIPAGA